MAVPTPRRTPSGGGTPLIILGIVLALATGALVLYLTNGGGGGQTTAVITAARDLSPGTILTTDTNPKDGAMQVAEAFHVQHIPAGMVPSDALRPTDPNWSDKLNGQAIQESFSAGDIVHVNGAEVNRMQPVAGGPASSLARLHPSEFPDGSVLYPLKNPESGLKLNRNDRIDILATECSTSGAQGSCQMTQTTLQNLLIYEMVDGGTIILVLSHQDALALKMLVETAKLDIVLRKPGDTAPADTTPIDLGWLMSHFHFPSS